MWVLVYIYIRHRACATAWHELWQSCLALPSLLPSFTTIVYHRRFTTVVSPSFTTAVYCHRSVTVSVLLSVCWNILKGTPPNPPRGSRGCRPRPPLVNQKSMYFRTCIFINIFSILAPIWAPFWSMFPDLCIVFSSIEFALIFYWFLIDFWDPRSCEKTCLTLYSSQKSRNRRFWNFIDLPLILDLILASF